MGIFYLPSLRICKSFQKQIFLRAAVEEKQLVQVNTQSINGKGKAEEPFFFFFLFQSGLSPPPFPAAEIGLIALSI